MATAPANTAASVRQRLLNLARERGEPFDQLLQYFAVERFLARLAKTPWADDLVVKGATLLRVWGAPLARPTRDIDFHTRLADAPQAVVTAVSDIVAVQADDGLEFEPTVSADPIVVDGRYPGVRAVVRGTLSGARFKLQIDVGVGVDAVPEPAWVDYPTLLDMDSPHVLAYAPETSIAEKLEAMVALGEANSRLKDFYDIWRLAGTLEIDGKRLAAAIAATFAGRGTVLPGGVPVALTDVFATRPVAASQWKTFCAKPGIDASIPLSEVVEALAGFLMPVVGALAAGREFNLVWPPRGPWRSQGASSTGR